MPNIFSNNNSVEWPIDGVQCYVHRDEYLLVFLILLFLNVSLLFAKLWVWLNAPCLFLLSLSSPPQGKSPPPVARL